MTASRVDIGTIVGMLADQIDALVCELLPAAIREGNEWCVGSVAGEAGRSMKVNRSSTRAGVWADFSGGAQDRGDALDLVAQVLFRGDKKEALRWSRAWLRLDAVDPASFATQQAAARSKKQKAAVDENDRNRRAAQHIFIAAKPHLAGTPAETYLLGRGIDFRALGRQPSALRYAPELMHPETGELVPALVAAITSAAGDLVAVHRTYLERLPGGDVVKLRGVKDSKLTLGRYAGGCIRLWRGASNKPWNETPEGETAITGEGIEDTATGVTACPEYRALVAVSLANMGSLQLHPNVAEVIILAQNDPEEHPGRPGERHPARVAIERAIENFHRQGKRVRVARPDASAAHDLNELAQLEQKRGDLTQGASP